MRLATSATMLSAFLFPGSGHLMLKRKGMGWLLICATAAPTIYLVLAIVRATEKLFTLIQKGLLPPDFSIMVGYLIDRPFGPEGEMVQYCFYLIIAIWLGAAIDAYRLGHAMDMAAAK